MHKIISLPVWTIKVRTFLSVLNLFGYFAYNHQIADFQSVISVIWLFPIFAMKKKCLLTFLLSMSNSVLNPIVTFIVRYPGTVIVTDM